jgi:hypothetical protein
MAQAYEGGSNMAKRNRKRAESLPLINARTLSRSMRQRHYVAYTMVPKALGVLGCRDFALQAANICARDAERSEERGHRHVARVLRKAEAIFRVAARNMLRPHREAIAGWLGGSPRVSRQFRRPVGGK